MRLIGGGYAEYASVAARQCRKLPDGLDLVEGALVEPTSIGLHSVLQSGLKPGDRIAAKGAFKLRDDAKVSVKQAGNAEPQS